MTRYRSIAAAVVIIIAALTTTASAHRHHQQQNYYPPNPFAQGQYSHYGANEQPRVSKKYKKRYASKRHKRERANKETKIAAVDANGNAAKKTGWCKITSNAGAATRVACRFVDKFQLYVNLLEQQGARILELGGWRSGRCSDGRQHPCGKALDVCQRSRDVVNPACNLPSRKAMVAIAASIGLFEAGQWGDADRGHVQVTPTGRAWPRTVYAAALPEIKTPLPPDYEP